MSGCRSRRRIYEQHGPVDKLLSQAMEYAELNITMDLE